MAISTSPFKSTGTTLAYKLTPSASSFTTVGEIVNFDLGGTDVGVIDVTKLVDTVRQKIPGIPDNGEVTFTVYLVPGDATVVQLQTWSQASAVVPWLIQLPDDTTTPADGSTIPFNAFVSGFAMKGFEQDATPTADVTLTISGSVVLTPGT